MEENRTDVDFQVKVLFRLEMIVEEAQLAKGKYWIVSLV